MGIVWKMNESLAHEYPEEPQGKLKDFLVNPSQAEPTFKLAALSGDEAATILKKLDSFAPGWSPQVALMLAEGAFAVIQTVRLAKYQTQQNFRGIFAQGGELDLTMLRPKDVGGTPMRGTAAVGSLGLYGGTGAAVYTWLRAFTVNTSANIIPSQTMSQWGAMVYLGFVDPLEVPPVGAVQPTLFSVAVPPQTLNFQLGKTFGNNELYCAKLEKPIIIPPLGIQSWALMPWRTGDGKPQPIAIIASRSQDLTF